MQTNEDIFSDKGGDFKMFFLKVRMWGNSHVVALPKLLRAMTGIKKNDFLFMQVREDGVIEIQKTVITTRGKKISIKEEEEKYDNKGDTKN